MRSIGLKVLEQQAGGCLQHACSLLSLADAAAAAAVAGGGSSTFCPNSSSSPAHSLSGQSVGRSISTTRSIYMGRVFIRENLQKGAAKSSLFTRDNYEYLAQNKWSLFACKRVLSKHRAATKPHKHNGVTLVNRQLAQVIDAAQSQEELSGVVARHAHQMHPATLLKAMEQVTNLLLRRDSTPDYPGAALLMNQLAELMKQHLPTLKGPQLCRMLASFAKCRYAPRGEFLQEVLELLTADNNQRMNDLYPINTAQLLLSLTRLTNPQGSWPIVQAIRVRVEQQLQQQLKFYSGRAEKLQERLNELQQKLADWDASAEGSSTGEPAMADSEQAGSEAAEAAEAAAGSSTSSSNGSSSTGAASSEAGSTSAEAAATSSEAAAAGSDSTGVAEPSSSSNSSNSSGSGSGSRSTEQLRERDALVSLIDRTRKQLDSHILMHPVAIKNANALALAAFLLNSTGSSSPEYVSLLHQWLAQPVSLAGLFPNGAVQLWMTLKGQWARHEGQLAAAAAAGVGAGAGAGAAADGASGSASRSEEARVAAAGASSGGDLGEAAAGVAGADDGADALLFAGISGAGGAGTGAGVAEMQEARLATFFGPCVLENLAAATVKLVPSMSQQELGQVFNSLGRMRFSTPDLMAVLSDTMRALTASRTTSLLTRAAAAWAAAQLQHWDPVLLQPALLAALQEPDSLDGFVAARVLVATSQMPRAVIQQQGELLQQEVHKLSGARGPAPPLQPAAANAPAWVASLADNLAGRVSQCRPREIAYMLLSYSEIADIGVHQELFEAAAKHIELHAHTFTQFREMEMVATAFERMQFKQGLPALHALQKQMEDMQAAQ